MAELTELEARIETLERLVRETVSVPPDVVNRLAKIEGIVDDMDLRQQQIGRVVERANAATERAERAFEAQRAARDAATGEPRDQR